MRTGSVSFPLLLVKDRGGGLGGDSVAELSPSMWDPRFNPQNQTSKQTQERMQPPESPGDLRERLVRWLPAALLSVSAWAGYVCLMFAISTRWYPILCPLAHVTDSAQIFAGFLLSLPRWFKGHCLRELSFPVPHRSSLSVTPCRIPWIYFCHISYYQMLLHHQCGFLQLLTPLSRK